MRKKKKYMPSLGLAFSEGYEMRKLSEMAEKGWSLESFAFLGYRFRKTEPKKVIYSVDYRVEKGADLEEYYDIYQAGGWKHVCSSGNIHIFSSEPGTLPLYTDRVTLQEKYDSIFRTTRMLTVFFMLLSIVTFILWQQSNPGSMEIAAENLFYLSLAITTPCVMTFLAYRIRIRVLRNTRSK